MRLLLPGITAQAAATSCRIGPLKILLPPFAPTPGFRYVNSFRESSILSTRQASRTAETFERCGWLSRGTWRPPFLTTNFAANELLPITAPTDLDRTSAVDSYSHSIQ